MANYFEGIFGRSPFKPVQEHMDLCHQAAALVEDLLAKAGSQSWSEVEEIRKQIVALERRADDRKRDIRLTLPRGFFLPVARADLLDLLSRQDKIANKAKEIAGIVVGRRMSFPPAIQDSALELARTSIAACRLALDVVNELDELIATGFRGVEVTRVEEMIDALDESESRNDDAQVSVRAELHGLEQNLDAVDVIFLYRIIDRIGDRVNLESDL